MNFHIAFLDPDQPDQMFSHWHAEHRLDCSKLQSDQGLHNLPLRETYLASEVGASIQKCSVKGEKKTQTLMVYVISVLYTQCLCMSI